VAAYALLETQEPEDRAHWALAGGVTTTGGTTTGGTGEASTCLLPVMVTADEPGDPNAAPPVGSDRAIVKLRVPAKGDAVLTATVKLLVDVSFFAQVSVPPALV
jgi:hypothetical protein